MNTNIFYLTNWGFSYNDLMNLEITEFREFVKLLIEDRDKEREQAKGNTESDKKEQKSIGQMNPGNR